MFNEELTLDDFVCPIAICQPEADLGSLLEIFQNNSCDLIAISSKKQGWRTIRSGVLLAQLGSLWQSKGFALVSHPRWLSDQESCLNPKITDVKHLLEPANVYCANVKLSEFLQNLEKVDFSQTSTEYLVVDEFDQLKGKLDQQKILRYLGSVVNTIPSQAALRIYTVDDFVRNFLDSVAFPLKIETAKGESVYTNRCWKKLTSLSERGDELPNAEIANWRIRQKFPIFEKNTNTVNQNPSREPHFNCNHNVSPDNIEQINGLEIHDMKYLSSSFSDHCAASNIFPIETASAAISESLSFSHFDIQIEQNQDWNQIKIPIALVPNREQITTDPDDDLLYWLVFATKTNKNLVANHSSVENIAKSDKLVMELISTISHELKSPLTGIIGLSSLLKDQQLGSLTQRQTLYTKLINDSGHKLMDIVNDLLELQGLEENNVSVNVERFNLLALCHQVYDQACHKRKVTNITESHSSFVDVQLKVQIEPELEIVTTNKRNLTVILSHLFLEILQFVDSASNVVMVRITQDSNEILVKIDNGISLLRSSWFASTTSKSSSGWNLTLAKYLVRGIEGSIESYIMQGGLQLTLMFPCHNSILSNTFPCKNTKPNNLPANNPKSQPKNITILCLYPEIDVLSSAQDICSSLDFNLKNWAEKDWSNIGENPLNYQYRIIEADGLEQAHTLARIWRLDVIIIDGHQIVEPKKYLQLLQQSSHLAALPLITLDKRTTEAANLVEGLNIYPCLLPDECRSVNDLMQVIRIATGLEK